MWWSIPSAGRAERWNIWQMHLPTEHQIDATLLGDVAGRCVMTGGQIRNAALHASVLALERGEVMKSHIWKRRYIASIANWELSARCAVRYHWLWLASRPWPPLRDHGFPLHCRRLHPKQQFL